MSLILHFSSSMVVSPSLSSGNCSGIAEREGGGRGAGRLNQCRFTTCETNLSCVPTTPSLQRDAGGTRRHIISLVNVDHFSFFFGLCCGFV